ncbi:MAG: hypothetical protein ACYDAQ_01570 [Mycobacteriales bacterium]
MEPWVGPPDRADSPVGLERRVSDLEVIVRQLDEQRLAELVRAAVREVLGEVTKDVNEHVDHAVLALAEVVLRRGSLPAVEPAPVAEDRGPAAGNRRQPHWVLQPPQP